MDLEDGSVIAFRLLSVERLSAVAYEPNKASIRVLEKNGFALEGRKAHSVRSKGIVYDTLLYRLLFKDWLNNNPELRKSSYDFRYP